MFPRYYMYNDRSIDYRFKSSTAQKEPVVKELKYFSIFRASVCSERVKIFQHISSISMQSWKEAFFKIFSIFWSFYWRNKLQDQEVKGQSGSYGVERSYVLLTNVSGKINKRKSEIFVESIRDLFFSGCFWNKLYNRVAVIIINIYTSLQ